MKKLISSIIFLLAIPQLLFGFATTSVPWVATSSSFIIPNKINGVDPYIYIPSAATSSIAHGLVTPCVAYSVGGPCVGGSTGLSTNPFVATYFIATSSVATSTFPLIYSDDIYGSTTQAYNINLVDGFISSLGITAIDFSNRHLRDSSGVDSVNWEGRVLSDAFGGASINYNGRQFIDSSNIQSGDYQGRILSAQNGQPTINWDGMQLINSAGGTRVDWQNNILYDSGGNPTLRWEDGIFTDSSNVNSAQMRGRNLDSDDGNSILAWNNNNISLPRMADGCLQVTSNIATSTGSPCSSGSGGVTSVDMTVPTGLSIAGNPITTAGTLMLTLTPGYNIPLTASTTNWNNFYDTPSTRITAGTGLAWSGNTLNASTTALNYWTLIGSSVYRPTGNVGVATTTSSNALEVAGNGYFSGNIVTTNVIATGTLSVSGKSTLANASSTSLTVSGPLFVTGQTTLATASTTGLTSSGILVVQGQTTLASASSTALTVSGPLFVTGQSTLATASSTGLTVSGLTFLQGTTMTLSTTTSATTTNFSAVTATTTNFTATNATTTKLVSTQATTTTLAITSITNSFLAANGTGQVIATTSPAAGYTGTTTIFTSTGTYTVPAGAQRICADLFGAGASGGQSDSGGGGGGGGGRWTGCFQASLLTSTINVIVGTGGVCSGCVAAQPGGDTSFGQWAIAHGAPNATGGIGMGPGSPTAGGNAITGGATGGNAGNNKGGDAGGFGAGGGGCGTAAGGAQNTRGTSLAGGVGTTGGIGASASSTEPTPAAGGGGTTSGTTGGTGGNPGGGGGCSKSGTGGTGGDGKAFITSS